MDNDGHDTSLEYAANWTLSFLTPLLANAQFMEKTLILLTYDESQTYSIPNRIASLLLGGAVPDNLKGTSDSTVYTHYSILSTLENNWGLPNLGRYDVGANVFDLVSKQTGYQNTYPANFINNSLSYPGFLNNNPDEYLPVPAPNLLLVGAGGQGVVSTVLNQWRFASLQTTPYDGSGNIFDGGNGTVAENSPVYKAQAVAANRTAINTTTSATTKSGAVHTRLFDLNLAGLGLLVLTLATFII